MKGINKWADGEWLFILVTVGILGWWIYSTQITNIESYLKDHTAVLSLEDNYWEDLALLDEDLEGKEIILTGESHGVQANIALELKFMKYFKEKTPLKYYLCEVSYAHAAYLNQYLVTGDEEILRKLYKPMQGTYYYTQESYKRWVMLYEYNQTLRPADRIQVVGIDIEHQIDTATEYLKEILPIKEIPQEIKEKINLVEAANQLTQEAAKELMADMIVNEQVYKSYLGEDYFDFVIVCRNIAYAYEAYEKERGFNKLRDELMYENFKVIYERLPSGVYYGQWGLNHVFQEVQGDINWLAGYLAKNAFEDKVLSIAYLYKDSQVMTRAAKNTYGKKRFTSLADNYNLLKGLPENENILLRLNGEKSPFDKKLIWPISYQAGGDTPQKGVTTDYFQYLVVIRGSEATTSLGE